MRQDGKIDYVEFPAGDLVPLKRFYEAAFGWTFTDYGPTYAAISEGLDGGFTATRAAAFRSPWWCSTPTTWRPWRPRCAPPAGRS
jgi:predicted enzyme related to lactoylglutathione lyase